MTSSDLLLMFAELFGGLAFFLYGMSAMSAGLEQMAGGALDRTLKKVTKNDFISFLVGAGMTIAIQSSSALTVMLVGLVNSGIMEFADTFGMIMGSHVGTTLTSWILTLTGIQGENFFLTLLKPMTFAPILALVGVAFRMFSKRERKRNLGLILIGFAVLMTGMDMMSGSMERFKQDPAFQSMLVAFTSPMLAFLVSTVFTGIIQSSAATVAIVQAMTLAAATTGTPISYQVAIPLVLGANIGTCMTALISSIGTSRDAKRVVAMHIYTNAIGGFVCVVLMYIAMAISPNVFLVPISLFGVAMVHTIFNIVNTIAFTPLKKSMIRLCEKTVKTGSKSTHTVFLDERLFQNSALAVSECHRLTNEMAEYTRTALLESLEIIEEFDEQKADHIRELEKLTDKYEDKLGTYLVRLSRGELSDGESHSVSRLLHTIGDLERISDHARNISEAAREIKEKKIVFSIPAKEELKVIVAALKETLGITIDSFIKDDIELAGNVEPLEQVIDKLKKEMMERHVDRLQNGKCTIQLGFVFSDLLTNFERVSDHCSNIAVYTLQLKSSKLDSHKFLKKIRNEENGEFAHKFNEYEEKYSL